MDMLAGRDLDLNAVGLPPIADRLIVMHFEQSTVIVQYMKKQRLHPAYAESDESSVSCIDMGPHMIVTGYARKYYHSFFCAENIPMLLLPLQLYFQGSLCSELSTLVIYQRNQRLTRLCPQSCTCSEVGTNTDELLLVIGYPLLFTLQIRLYSIWKVSLRMFHAAHLLLQHRTFALTLIVTARLLFISPCFSNVMLHHSVSVPVQHSQYSPSCAPYYTNGVLAATKHICSMSAQQFQK